MVNAENYFLISLKMNFLIPWFVGSFIFLEINLHKYACDVLFDIYRKNEFPYFVFTQSQETQKTIDTADVLVSQTNKQTKIFC